MEDTEKIKQPNINNLANQLEDAGIDFSNWGTGSSKTLEHLVTEIECRETLLKVSENNELMRISEVVAATIFYDHDNGKKYRLKEDRQVFRDGRERIRSSAGQSVFEKMKPGENPTEAIVRGITEELGIDENILLRYIDKIEDIADSKSYPGLQTKSTTHLFEVMMTAEQFQPQGYIEEQSDKVTYFIWELI